MTEPVTRWWWVRHGPVVGHDAICIGQLDLAADLSDGPAIARLSETLPARPAWVTSPLGRARNTLKAIRAHRGGDNTEPVVESGFAEQHFGDWQGFTYDAVRAETGNDAWRTPSQIQPPGGESFETVVGRVASTIERVGATFSGGEIVAVAHAGPIRAALATALDLTPDRALALSIDPLSMTAFARHGDGAWRVEFVNRLA